jgi:signal peptidase I
MTSEREPVPDAVDSPPGRDTALAEAMEVRPAAALGRSRSNRRVFQALVGLARDMVIAVAACTFLIVYVGQAFKVQGSSMSPTLVDGERILVNKLFYHWRPIERGDVVVFWYPEEPDVSFIKRVVGLPGDLLEIERGRLLINGEQVTESYVAAENEDRRGLPPTEVRPGHYFVMGDNRRGSNDSRNWGLVPRRYIYGKAFLCIWPPSKVGLVE